MLTEEQIKQINKAALKAQIDKGDDGTITLPALQVYELTAALLVACERLAMWAAFEKIMNLPQG
jgi:hypothetical protein